MKTTKEKIEVMQAYADGKHIQFYNKIRRGDWITTSDPVWDWVNYDYRIEPEPKKPTYRPYKSVDEMVEDFDKRFPYQHKRPKYTMPFIWVKNSEFKSIELIENFWDNPKQLSALFEIATYLDGTPVGKLVEE